MPIVLMTIVSNDSIKTTANGLIKVPPINLSGNQIYPAIAEQGRNVTEVDIAMATNHCNKIL
jgi:hypothetical protein